MNKKAFRLLIIEDDDANRSIQVVGPSRCENSGGTQRRNGPGYITAGPGTVYGGILLDHDLQKRTVTQMDRSLSGTQVIESIISNIGPEVPVLIHSTNSAGSAVMMGRLWREVFL